MCACCVWLVCTQYDNTALMWAALGGHVSVVELLLNRGAQVNAQNKVRKGVWLMCWDGVCERRKKTYTTSQREREQCVLLLWL